MLLDGKDLRFWMTINIRSVKKGRKISLKSILPLMTSTKLQATSGDPAMLGRSGSGYSLVYSWS
jgi:hypothetical protein